MLSALWRAGALISSLIIVGVLMVYAAPVAPPPPPPRPPPPDLARHYKIKRSELMRRRPVLRMAATKSDPHLARMLAEEAAKRAGVNLGLLKAEFGDDEIEEDVDGGAP